MKTIKINILFIIVSIALFKPINLQAQSDGLDDRFRTEDTFRDSTFMSTKNFSESTNKPNNGVGLYSVSPNQQPKPGFMFSILLSPQIGYEGNPLHSQSAHGSGFVGVELKPSLSYTTNAFSLYAEYDFKSQFYNDEQISGGKPFSTADNLQHKFTLGISKKFGDSLLIGMAGLGSYTMTGEHPFSDSIGASPSIIYGWNTKWIASGLTYSYASFDDLTHSSVASLVDNADEQSLRFETSLFSTDFLDRCTNWMSSFTVGYTHKWHDADGALRSYQKDQVDIDLIGPILKLKTLNYEIQYAHAWQDYSNAGGADSGGKRNDNYDDVTFKISWSVLHQPHNIVSYRPSDVVLGIAYDYQIKNSNDSSVEYGDNTLTLGVQLKF